MLKYYLFLITHLKTFEMYLIFFIKTKNPSSYKKRNKHFILSKCQLHSYFFNFLENDKININIRQKIIFISVKKRYVCAGGREGALL